MIGPYMYSECIDSCVRAIRPLDDVWLSRAQKRQESLTKPHHALGTLEFLANKIAAMQHTVTPGISHAQIHCYAADHGVAQLGVSAYPQEVTAQMIVNIAQGKAGVNTFAQTFGVEVIPFDIGVATSTEHEKSVLQRNVSRGSRNMIFEDALTRLEVIRAIETGIREVTDRVFSGELDCVGLGEVGIGNTTVSAVLIAHLTNASAQEVTGCGTGVSDEVYQYKCTVIKTMLETRVNGIIDPIELLCKAGGLEICALVGTILGAAYNSIPVVLDGAISASAALVAQQISPVCIEYIVPSHISREPACALALKKLGFDPLFDVHLALGEGTGAVFGIAFLQAACNALSHMATFSDAGVATKLEDM